MFGIPELKQSLDERLLSLIATNAELGKSMATLSDTVERVSHVVKASAIDTNARMSAVEADRTRMLGAVDILREYEESHATYTQHTVNGFELRERIPHDCALCVAARKYL